MQDIELSIIVPVYNCEKTINVCLDSILNSNYKNFEVIIINDSSNDNTEKILEEYRKFNNIRIENLSENSGVSFCRNLGIGLAKADYITFVDGDDYIGATCC